MTSLRVHFLTGLLCLAAATPLSARPITEEARNRELDRGKFTISVHGHVIGAENFGIEARADSINCLARSFRTQRAEQGDEQIEKYVGMSFGRMDWGLRFYQSEETFRGQTLIRGVTMDPTDTAFTVFKEQKDGAGTATRLISAPGRTFVLDSGLYTLFDLMCVYLGEQSFTSRPLNILTFGEPDTVIEATVTNRGPETIHWASKTVSARKLEFSQGGTRFDAWVDPAGRMLRLAHVPSGLLVERVPEAKPSTKKPAAAAPKSATPKSSTTKAATPAPKPGG
jgi:hypothetical protein